MLYSYSMVTVLRLLYFPSFFKDVFKETLLISWLFIISIAYKYSCSLIEHQWAIGFCKIARFHEMFQSRALCYKEPKSSDASLGCTYRYYSARAVEWKLFITEWWTQTKLNRKQPMNTNRWIQPSWWRNLSARIIFFIIQSEVVIEKRSSFKLFFNSRMFLPHKSITCNTYLSIKRCWINAQWKILPPTLLKENIFKMRYDNCEIFRHPPPVQTRYSSLNSSSTLEDNDFGIG